MIQANELRIGNWVKYQFHDGLKEVKICSNDFKMLDDENLKKYKERYEPIPLTEQWLIDFGFGKHITLDTYPTYSLNNINVNDGVVFIVGFGFVNHIKHVHQLQNLYFALTGLELNKQ